MFSGQKGQYFGFLKRKERPDDGGKGILERGKSLLARSSDQIEKECFGDIIHGVAGRNAIKTITLPKAIKESVADEAESLLEIIFR